MNKLKKIWIGNYQLQTPNLFASYRLGDCPNAGLRFLPWKLTRTEGVLINAFDLLRKRYYEEVIEKGTGIAKHIQFEKAIMVDSGGYYFIRHNIVDVDPRRVLDVQLKSGASLGVVLDHPFTFSATDKSQRIETTLLNTTTMFTSLNGQNATMNLMPVIHGHNRDEILHSIHRTKSVLQRCGSQQLDRIGIGSLVPLAQHPSLRTRIVEVITVARASLPHPHIHCFALGSPMTMLLAFYCGADTVDSQGWMLNAAFRYVHLPGLPAVRLSARHKTKSPDVFSQKQRLFEDHLEKLNRDEGFEPLFASTEELIDTDEESRVHNRAVHNLYVYNYEARKAQEAITEGKFEQFIESRFKGTTFERLFVYAKALKASPNISK